VHEFRPYKALALINSASPTVATELFASCTGSALWVERMAESRPFAMLDDLYRAAELAWFAVAATERLADLDAYTEVEKRLDSMLEHLGCDESLEAKAGA
jgi:hypothetical protein